MQFEMAQDDQTFIDRIMFMTDDEILAYLHALPAAEKKAMGEAIFRAMCQRAVRDYMDGLNGGFWQ